MSSVRPNFCVELVRPGGQAVEQKFMDAASAYGFDASTPKARQGLTEFAESVCSDARTYGAQVAGDNAANKVQSLNGSATQGRLLAVTAVGYYCPDVADQFKH